MAKVHLGLIDSLRVWNAQRNFKNAIGKVLVGELVTGSTQSGLKVKDCVNPLMKQVLGALLQEKKETFIRRLKEGGKPLATADIYLTDVKNFSAKLHQAVIVQRNYLSATLNYPADETSSLLMLSSTDLAFKQKSATELAGGIDWTALRWTMADERAKCAMQIGPNQYAL